MHEHKIHGEYMEFSESCHSAADAEKAVGANPGEVIKNICLIDNAGKIITVTVCGEDRASTTKVGELLKIDRPRQATPNEVLSQTGYPVGGVPSFGFESTFIIDDKIMAKETIYTSGGTTNSIIKMQPTELARASKAIIAKVRK